MSKALIEKARKYAKGLYGSTSALIPYIVDGAEFGANWQREQLEAEIKELKEQITDLTNGNYKKGIHTMEQLHKIVEDRNKTIDWWTNKGFEDLDKIKDLQAENKTIREQIIQELREYCSKGFECGYGEVISCQDLTAKLDLLEGKK